MGLIEPLKYRRNGNYGSQDIVVFLDRDGTLTVERGIINTSENLILEPTAIAAIKSLNRLQIPTFVLTNQPGVARGFISEEILIQTHQKLIRLLQKSGVYIDGIYVCPHLSADGTEYSCKCHKPDIGLAKKAMEDFNLNPQRIYVIGDRASDIELAKNLGGKGVLVKTGYGLGEWENNKQNFRSQPEYVAENIEDAVRWILLSEFEFHPDVFRLPIPHYKWPEITINMEQAVKEQLYLTISIDDNTGIIKEYEQEWCSCTDRKYAVSFNSGTMALYSAFRAIGISYGDEVIIPAFGFFSTASPLLTIGAIPIFVDVDPTGNLDPEKIEAKISKKTRAIVVSHIFGIPANMSKILEIANKHCLPIIEDASHAFGASQAENKVGKFGNISVFSLQANKLCPAGEGGILLTDDYDIYVLATFQGHFNKRNVSIVSEKDELFKFNKTGCGLKLRLHPLAAAIGLETLRKVTELRKIREQCYFEMLDILKDVSFLSEVKPDYQASVSYYNFPLLLSHDLVPFKNSLIDELRSNGYESLFNNFSTGVIPCLPLFLTPDILFPDFPKNRLSFDKEDFINAFDFNSRLILLPLWNHMIEFAIAKKYALALMKKLHEFNFKLQHQ